MDSLRKIHLLVIDDIGLKSYGHDEARDLLEIAELRYNRSSTIFASQIPYEKWYELIEDPTIADAFMDRVVHNSIILPLDSKTSMREIVAQKRMNMLDLNDDNQ
jgi:DNA replication protein DnaC